MKPSPIRAGLVVGWRSSANAEGADASLGLREGEIGALASLGWGEGEIGALASLGWGEGDVDAFALLGWGWRGVGDFALLVGRFLIVGPARVWVVVRV